VIAEYQRHQTKRKF